jgi:CubicO group peptidase (beta-lactamase class C family)
VSIAVINDGHVEWAAGYGVRVVGSSDSVTVSTLFQAASISKPVTALAALRLVDEGHLDLDSDVNRWLRSWQIPESRYTLEQPVTLRSLLSHTAGFNVGGFPGYRRGAVVPSAVDVLEGRGNTAAVRLDTVPRSRFQYSGGGYTVAQVLIEDVTHESFQDALKRLVLDPLGMYQSTFAQPLPTPLREEAASAHERNVGPVDGRWLTHPELAAAGLWTTPMDLARFALGIRAAYLSERGAILSPATAKEMLTVQKGGYGLGPGLGGEAETLLFAHPGGNVGFRAFFVLHAHTGDGVVVMSNADGGDALNMEIVRAVSRVYDWPFFKPEVAR